LMAVARLVETFRGAMLECFEVMLGINYAAGCDERAKCISTRVQPWLRLWVA